MMRFKTEFGAVSALAVAAMTPSLALAGVIEGRVSDQSGNVALEGAIVRITETGATAATDRSGAYRFVNVDAGDYTLSVSYVGAAPAEATVSLAADSDTVLQDIRLGDDVSTVDNILVVGQRGALNSGLSREKAADDFRSVLSADAIGQFPDENVAEAARRAVGVNVLNDQGEGRFVSIRGLDPNLSSTTINGVRIPSPEAGDRNVPLDVIDSDLLSAVVINKSLTPDVDGDSIGGNIEIETLSGLERSDMLFKLKAAGMYSELVDKLGQKYAATFADNFMNEKLGVAASLSYRKKEFGSDNLEVDDSEWSADAGELFPQELEQRNYRITRERLSAALNLDYQASDDLLLYAHSLFSRFEDQEYRSRVEAKFGDGEFDRMEGDVSIIAASDDDEFEVDRDSKDRLETQTIFSAVAGGEWTSDAWTVDVSGAYSHSEEKEPNRIDTAFRAKFDDGEFGINVADTILPQFAFNDDASDAFFDAGNYEFDELEFLNGVTTDEEIAAQFNVQYDTEIFGAPGYFKAGGKARLREKDYGVTSLVYDGFAGDGLDTLADVPHFSGQYRLGDIGITPDPFAIRDFFFANQGDFEIHDFDTAINSTVSDYTAEENIYAGYVMAKVDIDRLRLVGGVRFEHTEFNAAALGVLEFETKFDGDVEDTVTLADLDVGVSGATLLADLDADYDDDDDETTVEAVFSVPQTASQSYSDWLPSLNARYEVQDNIIARLGYYKSIVRPNISQIVPAAELAQDEDELEASLGNPNLERQKAHNVDALIAWYPNNDSVVMAGAFYKRLTDFIAKQTFSGFDFNGATYEEATIPVNLETVDLFGFELNYQQQFNFLPAPFDGLIAGANYTFVDADVYLPEEDRTIALPRQSKHVANFVLGYEKGPIDFRAVATYRDDYLDEINHGGEGVDRIVDDHLQVDLSAKYKFNDNLKFYAEAKNVTNEPYVAFVNDGDFTRLNSQYEEYGRTFEFGATYQF